MTGPLMAQQAKVTPLMSKDLADFPGKEGLMIMVEYPPGSADPIHRHNAHAFLYVLEGSIVMQVKGGKQVTLTPGQTFYEGPDDVHIVGHNASNTKPAKFVVLPGQEQGCTCADPSEVTSTAGQVSELQLHHSPPRDRIYNVLVSEHRRKDSVMKIVVIGGSGLIGSKLVTKLGEHGHEAVAASPTPASTRSPAKAWPKRSTGAEVVVDVSNSPSFEDEAVMDFFETSTRNLLAAEAAAGVGHHVALSVVGTERLLDSGYFRAKLAQEKLIKALLDPVLDRARDAVLRVRRAASPTSATDGDTVRLAPALIQPMAAEDVASAVARVAVGPPVNGIVEVAGPERFRLDELVRRPAGAQRSAPSRHRPASTYFGVKVTERELVPDNAASLGKIRFDEWLAQSA